MHEMEKTIFVQNDFKKKWERLIRFINLDLFVVFLTKYF